MITTIQLITKPLETLKTIQTITNIHETILFFKTVKTLPTHVKTNNADKAINIGMKIDKLIIS